MSHLYYRPFRLLISIALLAFGQTYSPALALEGKSQNGLIKAELTGVTAAAPLHKMHHWHLKLKSLNDVALSGAQIDISGETLDHPHALPTSPRITKEIEPGHYILDGIKFDRQGDWLLKLSIQANNVRDSISFKIPVDVKIWADWHDGWNMDERQVLKSLWIGSLPKLPPDPTNKMADSVLAADFGHKLFFDRRLSRDGSVACSTCHIPDLAFTDGRKLAEGVGQTSRNAPTIIGVAYSPWLFWDGRKDSLWSQALGPIENPLEHGTTRAKVVALLRKDSDYRQRYQSLFGALPKAGDQTGTNQAFINLGKAIAAYERKIMPAPTKFDRYVEAILGHKNPVPEDQFTIEEIAGLKVFISDNQGQCIRCHNGPMFTDNNFHNIGSHIVGKKVTEQGRAIGLKLALSDQTNCKSKFNDEAKPVCAELKFAKHSGIETLGAFKTPTLRYVAKTAPYMHAGQFQTLEDAIWQYRDVPPATVGQSELQNLIMSDAQFRQIEDFLKTLNGPINAPEKYLHPPE